MIHLWCRFVSDFDYESKLIWAGWRENRPRLAMRTLPAWTNRRLTLDRRRERGEQEAPAWPAHLRRSVVGFSVRQAALWVCPVRSATARSNMNAGAVMPHGKPSKRSLLEYGEWK